MKNLTSAYKVLNKSYFKELKTGLYLTVSAIKWLKRSILL